MFPKSLAFGNDDHVYRKRGVKGHGGNVMIFVAFDVGWTIGRFLGHGSSEIVAQNIALAGTRKK
jgi:hypothetical protein